MLNKVILMGRLTRDPELRATAADVSVATFTLAVDRGYSRRDNSPQQTADFINVVAWRGTAEFVCRWFSKGQLVAVSGRLQVRSYEDREGNKRTVTEVIADEAFFAEGKRKETSGGEARGPLEPVEVDLPGYEELVGDDGELPF